MTDDARLELRILDLADAPRRTDALVSSVMAEIKRRPRADGVHELRRYRLVLLAAAAVLCAIALVAMRAFPAGSQVAAADMIAGWAREGHVPTNGELLAAYQGYRP